jgi:hypothetical protein
MIQIRRITDFLSKKKYLPMFERDPLRNRIRKMPVYQKARQILQLVEAIAVLVDKDNFLQKETIQHMMGQAHLIPAKIAGAEGAGLYDIKMQNAALIRQAALDITTFRHTLDMEGYPHKEYLDLIPYEMEEFRILFVDWVSAFDPWDSITDPWGLFNPPGHNTDDQEPPLEG